MEQKSVEGGRRLFTVAGAVHVTLFVYWVFVHVHESSLISQVEKTTGSDVARLFPRFLEFPGRWRFMTFVNMFTQLVFYGLCCVHHIIPSGGVVSKYLTKLLDLTFTTVIFPTSFVVFAVFWPIYYLDRESIFPSFFAKLVPVYLVHFYHTGIVIIALLETLLVCHRYPSTLVGLFIMSAFNSAYLCMMISSLLVLGQWPYDFLNKLPPVGLVIFCGTSFLLYILMFYVGKVLSYLRWGDRLRHVKHE